MSRMVGRLPPLIRDAIGLQEISATRLVALDRSAGGSGKSERTDRFYGWIGDCSGKSIATCMEREERGECSLGQRTEG